ncbi:MAG: hypothetical protein ABSD92_11075 [Candidatus Bathyarchaeia archaeon]|jgi:hypothetical protein
MKTKPIRKHKLVKAWKTLSRNPLPKVKAFELSDEDFNRAIQDRHCFEDKLREIEEWGRIIPPKRTDACVFNAEENADAKYIILVREKPYHNLDEIILHELSHIAKGDL